MERLTVKRPADDDNLWSFQRADRELQFDLPTPGALPPFLLEDRDGERFEAHDADAATALSRKSSGP